MKKWYKNNLTKGILIVLSYIGVLVMGICFTGMAFFSGDISDVFSLNAPKKYEETVTFEEQFYNDISHIINGIALNENVENEKIIDLEQYYNFREITEGKNATVAYKGSDLVKWADSGSAHTTEQKDQLYVLSHQGEYTYYTYEELAKRIENKILVPNYDEGQKELSTQEVIQLFENGTMYTVMSGIVDKERETVYDEIWLFGEELLKEEYKPQGYESLVEIANTVPEWNGRLDELYQMVESCIYTFADEYEEAVDVNRSFLEGNTSLSYIYEDHENKKTYTNVKDKDIEDLKKTGFYVSIRPTLKEAETNIKNLSKQKWYGMIKESVSSENYTFIANINIEKGIPDYYQQGEENFNTFGKNLGNYGKGAGAALFLILVSLIGLTAGAGELNWFDRWKTEIGAGCVIFAWMGTMFTIGSNLNDIGQINRMEPAVITAISIGFLMSWSCFLIGYLSLVRRIKGKNLWSNSVLKAFLSLAGMLIRNIGTLWKTLIAFIVWILLHYTAFGSVGTGYIFMIFAIDACALIYMLRQAYGKSVLYKGIKAIAEGDLNYKISVKHLKGTQREMAERINSIGEGLEKAVEESLRSERMKTDLITNVSHDIKTPLTSIINYVGLLKQEDFTDEKIRRYIEVLEEKAERLRVLTEDVVEASKVSSGNVKLEFMDINIVEMIQQVSGEFEDKLKERRLTEILNLPDRELMIRADSRHTFRILENLYNNVSKYALEGTRVYGDLKVDGNQIEFSLKNISEEALNITPDELTERFIRGDESRTKEGSGLGLSIAKSLTELQGGSFALHLDGDLFKAVLRFNIIGKK